jgi:IclR family transcriptional regulator, acetate operon repressor
MSVERALRILELLAGNAAGLRLVEVAAALGADRANALRILAEMERQGFVQQDPISDRYRLTFMVTSLGFRHLEATGIGGWTQPVLDRLAETTQELVRMTVADSGRLRWVAKAQGANSALVLDPEMGAEVVLHATATGKAWLAAQPESEARALLRRHGMEPQTHATLTSVDAFMTELRQVRARGYATAVSEGEDGVLAVAAAIMAKGAHGEHVAVGTVSVAGPLPRVTPEKLDAWAPAARHAAKTLGDTWGTFAVQHLLRD